MSGEGKPNAAASGGKPKKRKYLPHGRPVRKGAYPLRPGVQGFFITCDGGRERQATNEAINLFDNFVEELLDGKDSGAKCKTVPGKLLNKITKFEDSDSSSSDDDSHPDGEDSRSERKEDEVEDPSTKKQRKDLDPPECEPGEKPEEKSIDDLIEDELKDLGDKNKRRFVSLESGCNGVIFIQMRKSAGVPGPSSIVEQMLSSAASTRKHMSRFILRILPAEVTCYASEEEISKAIKPLISEYFPTDVPNPQKFAVLYEARANTGVDRMKIINAVAKSVPQTHKVDLSNPDKTIIVQIAKTVCSIGIANRYKELSKYNLRQLTSPET